MALIYTMVTRLTGPRGQMIPLCVCVWGGGSLFFQGSSPGGVQGSATGGNILFFEGSATGRGILFFKAQLSWRGYFLFQDSDPGWGIIFSGLSSWRGYFLF